ncbi:MAG: signal peptide peptidase SppA [Pseudomonadota bacterium]
MTATADSIIERWKLRRRVALWRILAIVAVLIAVVALVPWNTSKETKDHIARISVDGPIFDDRARLDGIARVRDADSAKALIVSIASPGGTAAGSEAIFDALREVAEKKPVVALIGEVAASGGYIVAMGADRIYARKTSITGSIGVVSQIPNVTELLDSIGIQFAEVKSSPLKAAPNPVVPNDPAAMQALEDMVLNTFDWFTALVSDRRGLEGAALSAVTDGRVFTGRQAIDLGLVDAIGADSEMRAWLAEEHDLSTDLKVRDYRTKKAELPFPLDQFEDELSAFLPAARLHVAPGPRLMTIYTGP